MLTIGQLAKRVGLRTSALRYYEQEGLLTPDGRSPSGYRLYHPQAEQRLRLIQRAQRLGFSLADIRILLNGGQTADVAHEALIHTAENRYLALEKQITKRQVQQHELALFLQDLAQRTQPDNTLLAQMLTQVCRDVFTQSPTTTVLDRLMQYTNCHLSDESGQKIIDKLRGQHVHIWQEEETYTILVVSDDAAVAQALQELAQLESGCHTHAPTQPQFTLDDEGYLFTASGENAFMFARLFLALEAESKK